MILNIAHVIILMTCYYFNDLDLDNILINEKLFENILIYDIACKNSYDAKQLHIIFDELEVYMKNMTKT